MTKKRDIKGFFLAQTKYNLHCAPVVLTSNISL